MFLIHELERVLQIARGVYVFKQVYLVIKIKYFGYFFTDKCFNIFLKREYENMGVKGWGIGKSIWVLITLIILLEFSDK